jgi:hypothetical protein
MTPSGNTCAQPRAAVIGFSPSDRILTTGRPEYVESRKSSSKIVQPYTLPMAC